MSNNLIIIRNHIFDKILQSIAAEEIFIEKKEQPETQHLDVLSVPPEIVAACNATGVKLIDAHELLFKKSVADTEIYNECSICYETIEKFNVSITRCGHTFHTSCLLTSSSIKNQCPYCRAILFDQITTPALNQVNGVQLAEPLSLRDPTTWNQIAERLNALERRAQS